MSDTPRTDAKRSGPEHFMGDWVDANFACQLERELNAANESFRKLNIHALDLAARIQRLEEAGDEMFKWSERVGQEYWIKAKEAKP